MVKKTQDKTLRELLAEIEVTVSDLPQHLQQAAFSVLLTHALSQQKAGVGLQLPQQLSRSQLEAATTFGEYYADFPKDMSEEDKFLVGASFAEAESEDRAFTVRAANQLLKDIGVKLSNANVFAKRVKVKGFIFTLGKTGKKVLKFRVSREGHDHLKQLRESGR